MAGGGSLKEGGSPVFDITPHKIAVCHLVQVFALHTQPDMPFVFQSVSHHHRLGLFLFSLTRVRSDTPAIILLCLSFG
ncbi:hypothetical protein BHE74_00030857 [Ensete ventricosum]|uniref:Uncharacterized protein n=1 Tax=Ensete ventricosum TaxID=4639 RepID=A0A444EVW7_ENSVE|nr:hypothetical protein B296_00030215 [Ensete ventricosum]RWW14485.1 hypothetical protein GW17_00021740 [Ensete ventricosum]RWW62030.1 hypothetical protein BHE74_00030857 [Ensete ventricosum]RZS00641.1 hypothetical protein BHM03_00030377 [Ensete ventricosum]